MAKKNKQKDLQEFYGCDADMAEFLEDIGRGIVATQYDCEDSWRAADGRSLLSGKKIDKARTEGGWIYGIVRECMADTKTPEFQRRVSERSEGRRGHISGCGEWTSLATFAECINHPRFAVRDMFAQHSAVCGLLRMAMVWVRFASQDDARAAVAVLESRVNPSVCGTPGMAAAYASRMEILRSRAEKPHRPEQISLFDYLDDGRAPEREKAGPKVPPANGRKPRKIGARESALPIYE